MRDNLQQLSRHDIGQVTFNVPLSEHSSWRIGGLADMFVEPGSTQQVQNLIKELQKYELPYITIGGGSNILFDDAGVRGVVVKIGQKLSRFSIENDFVTAQAGSFVPCLVRSLGCAGLSGLEHAIGIPGTLGGLILMNGGSQRQGIGCRVDRVWAVDHYGELIEYDQRACNFSFRCSVFQQAKVVLIQARLKLDKGTSSTIRREMLEILRVRRGKFPMKQPNCGSVFLSDPSMYEAVGPPGSVIETCGFKGLQIGDAKISEQHANFIVNVSQASSRDVLELITQVRQGVFEETGYRLNCEVKYATPACKLVPAHDPLDNHRIA